MDSSGGWAAAALSNIGGVFNLGLFFYSAGTYDIRFILTATGVVFDLLIVGGTGRASLPLDWPCSSIRAISSFMNRLPKPNKM